MPSPNAPMANAEISDLQAPDSTSLSWTDAALREIELAGHGFNGFWAAAVDSITNHPLATAESLGVSIGMGLITSRLLPSRGLWAAAAKIGGQALALSFKLDILDNGQRVLGAFSDTAGSAAHWRDDVAVLEKCGGQFLFDTALMTSGGFSGFKLAEYLPATGGRLFAASDTLTDRVNLVARKAAIALGLDNGRLQFASEVASRNTLLAPPDISQFDQASLSLATEGPSVTSEKPRLGSKRGERLTEKTKLFQIRSTNGHRILFSYEARSLKEAVQEAVQQDTKLNYADLSGVDLSGIDLSGASLQYADLSHSNLTGTNLSDTDLSGANLTEALLIDANLNRTMASQAKFSGANLTRATMRAAYLYRSDLSRARLRQADLYETMLDVADMYGCDLKQALTASTHFTRANLAHATMTDLDLSSSYMLAANFRGADLRRTNFNGRDMRLVVLVHARLDGASFVGADLTGADLRGATARSAKLSTATLIDTQLQHADFTSANLDWADLRRASLRRAIVHNTSVTGADLTAADVRHTDLSTTQGQPASLKGARIASTGKRADTATETDFRPAPKNRQIIQALFSDRARALELLRLREQRYHPIHLREITEPLRSVTDVLREIQDQTPIARHAIARFKNFQLGVVSIITYGAESVVLRLENNTALKITDHFVNRGGKRAFDARTLAQSTRYGFYIQEAGDQFTIPGQYDSLSTHIKLSGYSWLDPGERQGGVVKRYVTGNGEHRLVKRPVLFDLNSVLHDPNRTGRMVGS